MDMNRYLLVAFYVVAGCTVTTPAVGLDFTNNSHQIWIELNTILDNNDVLLSDIIEDEEEPTAISMFKSRIQRILLSSLFALKPRDSFDFFQERFKFCKHIFYSNPLAKQLRNTSIQIRAPQVK